MARGTLAHALVAHEARALLTRLDRVEAFATQIPMVTAAAPSSQALHAIESHLQRGRRELRRRARAFLGWLEGPGGAAPASTAQRRFVLLRFRFNDLLGQVDVFADALSQRSEHRTGVWLAGLDRLAEDALALPGYYEPPPVLCYLDRGIGAAIRRARARLPGGAPSPVAIVRLPRERMIGAGIVSSLAHEVGHQATALLGLVPSLHADMWRRAPRGAARRPWALWNRWLSESVCDLWGLGCVGIAAAVGLLAVVSLPRPFVFRLSTDDPHPPPWMRMRLACRLGDALYPDSQWRRLAATWEELYPPGRLPASTRGTLAELDAAMPRLVDLLLEHRSPALDARPLGEVLHRPERTPERLRGAYRAWVADPSLAASATPAFAFAVVGQARASGLVSPADESGLLARMLRRWGLERAIGEAADAAVPAAAAGWRGPRRLVA